MARLVMYPASFLSSDSVNELRLHIIISTCVIKRCSSTHFPPFGAPPMFLRTRDECSYLSTSMHCFNQIGGSTDCTLDASNCSLILSHTFESAMMTCASSIEENGSPPTHFSILVTSQIEKHTHQNSFLALYSLHLDSNTFMEMELDRCPVLIQEYLFMDFARAYTATNERAWYEIAQWFLGVLPLLSESLTILSLRFGNYVASYWYLVRH